MRKISQVVNDAGTKKAIVRRDVENNEYVVTFYILNDYDAFVQTGTYHTDDKDDAIATALYEVSKV